MSRPKRIAGHPYIGVQRYFVTMCTRDRVSILTDNVAVTLVVDALVETALAHAMTIVVWCAMPDHVHLLVDGDHDGAEMTAFMKLAKQRSGFRFKQQFGRRLWQDGYHEHILRGEERTADVIRYVIANPVRKRLVENVMDYPFWGSMRATREELLASIDRPT